jgi:hypothetical protein
MSTDTPLSSPRAADPPVAVRPFRLFAPPADGAPDAPAPVLAFRVGVTGHRAEALAGADAALLRARVREVLEWVRGTVTDIGALHEAPYAQGGPLLRVISSLAEGADRIVTREALALGYTLQAPIPFARAEYARDFRSPASGDEFRQMLNDATSVLELDGVRGSNAESNTAYEMAGRTVLHQSDLLIAIWDGSEERGLGGTAQIVREAGGMDIPVLWIHSVPEHAIEYRPAGNERGTREQMRDRIHQMLVLAEDGDRQRVAEFLRENPRRRLFDRAFPFVLDLWTARPLQHREARVVEYGDDYRRADGLAMRYAERYRSSYTINFCLAPLAVLAGVLGYHAAAHGYHGPGFALAELLIIGSILLITAWGSRSRWHEKWLDSRQLAELFRQHAVLEPLGRVAPAFRIPAHARTVDPTLGWVHWLHRARVREKGMWRGELNSDTLKARRAELRALVKEQAWYHARNGHRLEKLDHRVHRVGVFLFGCTFLVCIGHLLLPMLLPPEHGDGSHAPALPGTWESLLTLIGIMFPALGAALAGFRSQGEFNRIARDSHAMVARMRELRYALAGIRRSTTSAMLGQRAEDVAETMVDELLGFRIIFREKPIVLPG